MKLSNINNIDSVEYEIDSNILRLIKYQLKKIEIIE